MVVLCHVQLQQHIACCAALCHSSTDLHICLHTQQNSAAAHNLHHINCAFSIRPVMSCLRSFRSADLRTVQYDIL